jgi:2-keto-4-pentenoate hydratase/2-oxohepta-3-ene-1,7-dioic acid hydratase in catechol pathway
MLAFLDAGPAARERAEQILEFAVSQRPPEVFHATNAVRLFAPIPQPRSIRDCMAFEQHLVRATRTVVKWRSPVLARLDAWAERRRGKALFGAPHVWYERPIYYKGNPHSVVGHESDVIWPSYTEKLDYELEFGVFLGRRGRDIPKDQARDYIAGYTIFNDFSARDVQLREMQGRLGPAKSKDFDTGNVLGPYLVTPEEIPDPYALTMAARVNGEQWSRGASGQMHYSFEEIIAYISQSETLHPGEFIGSGTVPSGCGLELDRWLQPGDTVELEVEGLGELRNRIVR